LIIDNIKFIINDYNLFIDNIKFYYYFGIYI
jgi:hypothetical protein